ncbi:MAG: hypothetical protein J6866_00205, partial [Victivallales bacterium]|nr:hypothetical protein [Victivallales bacterium]
RSLGEGGCSAKVPVGKAHGRVRLRPRRRARGKGWPAPLAAAVPDKKVPSVYARPSCILSVFKNF